MSHAAELTEVVDDFLASRCSPETVRAVEAGGDAAELWAEVEELGWTLATLPEEQGGAGATFADACAILRTAAGHAAPLPLGETSLIAAWLLHAAGLAAPSGPLTVAPVRREDALAIRRDGDGYALSGRARAVPWAPAASAVVVLAAGEDGERLVAVVPAPAVRRAHDATNLAGEPRSELDFDGIELADDAVGPAPAFLTHEALALRGALVRAVMLLGALERIERLTVEYARERRQFGRPIGRFQAVGHHVAQIARDVALARAAVEAAIEATRDDAAPPAVEVAIAKVMAGRAAWSVPQRAHQVHGAIGVTEEYALQLFTRRVWAWRDEFGAEREWARTLGAAAAGADGGLWGLISSIDDRRSA